MFFFGIYLCKSYFCRRIEVIKVVIINVFYLKNWLVWFKIYIKVFIIFLFIDWSKDNVVEVYFKCDWKIKCILWENFCREN